MSSASENWARAENNLALAGLGIDHLHIRPPGGPYLHPEDFPENSPERALAIRLPGLAGEDYRTAERVLRESLRLAAAVEDLLDRHGRPEDPADVSRMTDDWDDDVDYSRWDLLKARADDR